MPYEATRSIHQWRIQSCQFKSDIVAINSVASDWVDNTSSSSLVYKRAWINKSSGGYFHCCHKQFVHLIAVCNAIEKNFAWCSSIGSDWLGTDDGFLCTASEDSSDEHVLPGGPGGHVTNGVEHGVVSTSLYLLQAAHDNGLQWATFIHYSYRAQCDL